MKKLLIVSSLMLVGALAYGAADVERLVVKNPKRDKEGWQKNYLIDKGSYIDQQGKRDEFVQKASNFIDFFAIIGIDLKRLSEIISLTDKGSVISYAISEGKRVFNPDYEKNDRELYSQFNPIFQNAAKRVQELKERESAARGRVFELVATYSLQGGDQSRYNQWVRDINYGSVDGLQKVEAEIQRATEALTGQEKRRKEREEKRAAVVSTSDKRIGQRLFYADKSSPRVETTKLNAQKEGWIFSSSATFKQGDIVLIPRSSTTIENGWDYGYGRILERLSDGKYVVVVEYIEEGPKTNKIPPKFIGIKRQGVPLTGFIKKEHFKAPTREAEAEKEKTC